MNLKPMSDTMDRSTFDISNIPIGNSNLKSVKFKYDTG